MVWNNTEGKLTMDYFKMTAAHMLGSAISILIPHLPTYDNCNID